MEKKISILLIGIIVLLIIPLVYARNYSANTYGSGTYGIEEAPVTPTSPPSGGGGRTTTTYECSLDSDCDENEYCFNHICYAAECFDDSVCKKDEVCWHGRCVKLFDVEIIDFESPIELGTFFDFTYSLKGMAEINNDVEIQFWIEKEKEVVTSGQDTIYMSSFEQKTKTTKLFLPSDITSGKYVFYVQVSYGTYTAKSHRTIEIKVEEEIARITVPPTFWGFEIYMIIISILIASSVFILLLIIRILVKKFISKHQKSMD